jgi:hypothetical protein
MHPLETPENAITDAPFKNSRLPIDIFSHPFFLLFIIIPNSAHPLPFVTMTEVGSR